MAGIYIHVPFCKTRCAYCDFFSTTLHDMKSRYVDALCQELVMRRNYLHDAPIGTLYFGGGTPSQLSENDFHSIFNQIEKVYGLEACEEITLEANPDDLTDDYVEMLTTLPFNRISMGIQTFHEPTLQLIGRRHTAQEAIEAVHRCQQQGFTNISIDLIYGLPGETLEQWKEDLLMAFSLKVQHISAYHLTYEQGTRLWQMLQRKEICEVDEDTSVELFRILCEEMQKAGYEHYEISNFALPNFRSRHNSAYWHEVPYLGCGPGAHSFDGDSREWNVSSLPKYIEALEQGQRNYEQETLDKDTRYNEFVMTRLRTCEGFSLNDLQHRFGQAYHDYCLHLATPYMRHGLLLQKENTLRLSKEGIFVSDDIISDLMRV
ncbi:MAG: radical SAM family heme chaperone HemW [Bacteroidaceae bacterium]|nr:radical SAM family heme chaperone HemW [Bacteroidaceae bacterium]